jgi:hypothetical protein
VVADAYNPSYLGGGSRPAWAKKSGEILFSKNEQTVVLHTCNPTYVRGRGRRVASLRLVMGNSVRPYLKNN